VRTLNREPTAPCGLLGACSDCTPWGFGVAVLEGDPSPAREIAQRVESYWSVPYLTRVLDRLVQLGVVETTETAGASIYAVSPPYVVPVQRGALFPWLDTRFAGWDRGPDRPMRISDGNEGAPG
jgi:hypothetical protein